jgi:glycosyltransferase involved in cell wall biosynthesis
VYSCVPKERSLFKPYNVAKVLEMRRKLLIVANVDWFFVSHRLPIGLAALKDGYDVHLAMSFSAHFQSLADQGFKVHEIPFSRSGSSILQEFKTLRLLYTLIRQVNPDIIHAVTIKPSLYAGFLSKILRIKNIVLAVSGLGLVFVDKGWRATIRKWFIKNLYKLAIDKTCTKLIFQNRSDLEVIRNIVNIRDENFFLITGSGVDLSEYRYTPQLEGEKFIITLASRLLKEKGIYDFIRAIEIIKASERSKLIEFKLVGEPDLENPNSILPFELENWKKAGLVDYLGFRSDISTIFSQSNVIVLPSYYGEGLPKVLIEAAACGRAVITTDTPGCRDAILAGQTGVLVPPNSPSDLCNEILKLEENRHLSERMGLAGRALAERTFSIDYVISDHLKIYKSFLA